MASGDDLYKHELSTKSLFEEVSIFKNTVNLSVLITQVAGRWDLWSRPLPFLDEKEEEREIYIKFHQIPSQNVRGAWTILARD